jgi:cysteine synthase
MTLLSRIGNTPLVPLHGVTRGLELRVPVLAKCEHLNPGGSVKDRIAVAIVDDAERRGVLRPGHSVRATLVEATAGNTGMGLLLVAAERGYRVACVLPEKMNAEKRQALAALGAEVIVTKNAPPDSPDNFQNVARRLAAERGWFLTDQFENPANVRAHEETTAREIIEQTGGRIGAFVAGAGTGGTITGVGRAFAACGIRARVVLADPEGSGLARWVKEGVVGPDAAYKVEGIGSSKPAAIMDRSVIHDAETVSDDDSFAMTRRLWREEGLWVGGSSGTAVVAALRVARRGDIDGPVVVVLPDAWDRYRSCEWARG